MTKLSSIALSTTVIMSLAVSPLIAHAGPSGRSAKMAARLKVRPTSAWLAHYLPDDRYKIAGGIWKFVSTDLDTYYHRPDSPNMLRQPAGLVIGFSSVQEAEEAGYRAEPGMSNFGFSPMGQMSGPASALIGTRMMLSDGTSSLLLPKGWSGSRGTTTRSANAVVTTDQVNGPKGQRLVISTVTVVGATQQVDMSRIASVQFFRTMQNSLSQFSSRLGALSQTSGSINNQFSGERVQSQIRQMQTSTKVSAINMGGMAGIVVSSTMRTVGQPARSYLVGRGPKLWSVSDFGANKTGASAILQSLQLR